MAQYRVSATINGRRILTDIVFDSKIKAMAYADETNRYRHGANARVVKA